MVDSIDRALRKILLLSTLPAVKFIERDGVRVDKNIDRYCVPDEV